MYAKQQKCALSITAGVHSSAAGIASYGNLWRQSTPAPAPTSLKPPREIPVYKFFNL